MEFRCRVTPWGLVPEYGSDLEAKKRLKVGSTVTCRFFYERNPGFHRKFWALVRLVFDNLPYPLMEEWRVWSPEDMERKFKRDLGYFRTRRVEDGLTEIEYTSIAFDAMDQTEFERFYRQCVNLAVNRYISGTDPAELRERLVDFM